MSKAQKQTSIGSCFGNEEEDVLDSLRQKNLNRFSDLLQERSFDLDKEFQEDPCNGATLLERCCEQGLIDFCNILLSQPGVDVNRWSSVERRRPIHIATEKKDQTLLKLLLDKGVDVNGENWLGETALHIAARNNDVNCLELLFNHPNSKNVLDKNGIDKDGRPPVYVAASEKAREAVLFLAKHGADLELLSEADDESTKDILEREMPDVLKELSTFSINGVKDSSSGQTHKPNKDLFMALERNDLEKFQQALNNKADVNWFHGDQTCLHVACEKGMTKFVELLLQHKANHSLKNEADNWMAVHYAAAHGYQDILILLDRYDADLNSQTKSGLSPLHLVTNRGILYQTKDSNYDGCLEYLLQNDKVNVNLVDHLGNTPFHFAVRHKQEHIVLMMLNSNADFTKENEWGERPLDLISLQTMNTYFKKFIKSQGKDSKDFVITFDYDCLMPKGEDSNSEEDRQTYAKMELSRPVPKSETKVLRHIAKLKRHKELLKHPLIKSFLYLKWQKCRKFYFANTLVYLVFVAVLTFYCLEAFSSTRLTEHKNLAIMPTMTPHTPANSTAKENSCPVSLPWNVTLAGVVLFLVNTILAVRETFQFLVAPVRYVSMLENLAEWAMIICLYIVLVLNGTQCIIDHIQLGQGLAAVTLFLAWVELVLLCGRYRKFSVSVSIFLEVSWNFVQLMAWYIVLIFGFVFTFFLLFEPNEGFESLVGSFMKVMVMMTGEFDYGGIPIGTQPFVAHLTFLLFLFFVTIVLMNLLTALAVEDTREIRNNAEIIYQKNQLDLISYIEAMFFGDYEFLREYPSLSWVPHCFPMKSIFKRSSKSGCFRFFGNSILLFYRSLQSFKASVKPDHLTGTVETEDGSKLSISRTILKDTLLYLEGSEPEGELLERVSNLEAKVASSDVQLGNLCSQINDLNENVKLVLKELSQMKRLSGTTHVEVKPF